MGASWPPATNEQPEHLLPEEILGNFEHFWARRRMGCLSILVLVASLLAVQAADLRQKTRAERARRSAVDCPAFEPFRCPEESRCISIQYLCDGAPDCSDAYDENPRLSSAQPWVLAYDENPRLCTAARRPP